MSQTEKSLLQEKVPPKAIESGFLDDHHHQSENVKETAPPNSNTNSKNTATDPDTLLKRRKVEPENQIQDLVGSCHINNNNTENDAQRGGSLIHPFELLGTFFPIFLENYLALIDIMSLFAVHPKMRSNAHYTIPSHFLTQILEKRLFLHLQKRGLGFLMGITSVTVAITGSTILQVVLGKEWQASDIDVVISPPPFSGSNGLYVGELLTAHIPESMWHNLTMSNYHYLPHQNLYQGSKFEVVKANLFRSNQLTGERETLTAIDFILHGETGIRGFIERFDFDILKSYYLIDKKTWWTKHIPEMLNRNCYHCTPTDFPSMGRHTKYSLRLEPLGFKLMPRNTKAKRLQ